MKFKKELLQEVACMYPDEEEWEGFKVISKDITDTSRWAVHHSLIFSFEGKFYQTNYREGATEYQDESPFEHDPDEIECKEVKPVQKTITVYE